MIGEIAGGYEPFQQLPNVNDHHYGAIPGSG
jgi:hypothetical protein